MPSALQRNVMNVNVPGPSGGAVKGFYLASMGRSSVLTGLHIASSRLTSQVLQSLNLPEADPAVSVLTNTKASFQECDSTPGMKLAAMPQWIWFSARDAQCALFADVTVHALSLLCQLLCPYENCRVHAMQSLWHSSLL